MFKEREFEHYVSLVILLVAGALFGTVIALV
jgi:hypothetical protein